MPEISQILQIEKHNAIFCVAVAKCGEQHSCFTFDFGKCSTNDLGNMTREVCMRNNGNCKAGSGISHVCIMPNARKLTVLINYLDTISYIGCFDVMNSLPVC